MKTCRALRHRHASVSYEPEQTNCPLCDLIECIQVELKSPEHGLHANELECYSLERIGQCATELG